MSQETEAETELKHSNVNAFTAELNACSQTSMLYKNRKNEDTETGRQEEYQVTAEASVHAAANQEMLRLEETDGNHWKET